jgi:hypothetical protein
VPVRDGQLRAPRRWERLLVEAAVIGGCDRGEDLDRIVWRLFYWFCLFAEKAALEIAKGARANRRGRTFMTEWYPVEILDLHTETVAKPAKRHLVRRGYCCQNLCCGRGECANEDELSFAANWYVEQQHRQADEAMPVIAGSACSLGSER